MFKKFTILLIFILLTISGLYAQTNNLNSKSAIPNAFIENKGQILDQNNKINNEVLFLLNLPQFKLQIRNTGFSYDTYTVEEIIDTLTQFNDDEMDDREKSTITKLHFHRIDIELLNTNPQCEIKAEEPLSDYLNYFSKHIKNKQIIGVKQYQKIVYQQIYPLIDLEFVIERGQPKYNFILHPGANIKQIRWKYKGAKTRIKNNRIQLELKTGVLTEDIPLSYYKLEEGSEEVKLIYQYLGNNTYGFISIDKLNSNKTIVIDPIPEVMWATYYGGLLDSRALSITVDSKDNIYIGGLTNSTSNIATIGAYQTTLIGAANAFYTKFTKNGQRLYGTFYSALKYQADIECDNNDNVILSGIANEDSMGTSGVFQEVMPVGISGHIAKFDTIGNRIWATYFGALDMAVFNMFGAIDSSNNIMLAGRTRSNDTVITTTGTYQPGLSVQLDIDKSYLAKLDSSGNLVWGTYIGSEDETRVYTIATDKWNNTIISGFTRGHNFIGTVGTFMPNVLYPTGTVMTGFVMKFSPLGQKTWGTYYSSNSTFEGQVRFSKPYALTTDKSGYIYMAGETNTHIGTAGDSLSTIGVCQTAFGGGDRDAFIVKFNSNGTRNWASYYGGNNLDRAYGLSASMDGSIYMVGSSNSFNNIATSNALKENLDSNYYPGGQVMGNCFVVKFNTTGQRVYGTYYEVGIFSIKLDHYGKIIVGGRTDSSYLYTDSNSYQSSNLSNGTYWSAHFSKLSDCDLPEIPTVIASDTIVCPGEQISLNISGQLNDASQWNIYQNNILLGNTNGNSIQININDTSSIYINGAGGCVVKSDPAIINIDFDSIPIVDAGTDTSICLGYGLQLSATGNAQSYQWSNGVSNGNSYSPTTNHQLFVTAIGYNGCINTDTLNVIVNPLPIVTYTNGFAMICLNASPRPVYGGLPAGGEYSGVGLYNEIFYPDSVGLGSYQIIYKYTNTYGCHASAVDFILVDPCIGIEDLSSEISYNLYPNPAREQITFKIEGVIGKYTINIYDSRGSLLISKETDKSNNKINISGLASANYHFSITQDGMKLIGGSFVVE